MEKKSVYQRGAELGLPVGALLTAISMAMIFADRAPLLGTVALLLLLAGPWLICWLQRRHYVACQGRVQRAELWMLGIMMVLCGAIICLAVTYVVIERFVPDFIYSQADAALQIYKQMPGDTAATMAAAIEEARDKGLLPTTMQFVLQMFWLTSFSGAVLSLVTGYIARRLPLPHNQDNSSTTR